MDVPHKLRKLQTESQTAQTESQTQSEPKETNPKLNPNLNVVHKLKGDFTTMNRTDQTQLRPQAPQLRPQAPPNHPDLEALELPEHGEPTQHQIDLLPPPPAPRALVGRLPMVANRTNFDFDGPTRPGTPAGNSCSSATSTPRSQAEPNPQNAHQLYDLRHTKHQSNQNQIN